MFEKHKTSVFGVKSHFPWRKSATKFLCVKTVSDKVVRHSSPDYACKNDWWSEIPSTWNFGSDWPRWSEIADFRSIFSERRPSVCLSSVVCNVRAPYSDDWNVRQCFYAIWYLGHLWPFGKNFTEIVPGKPLRQGVKPKRGRKNVANFDFSKAISRKRCKIGGKLLLITNRKSHINFRLVPNSVTLNDLERRNKPNGCVISLNSVAFWADCVKMVEETRILSAAEM